MICHECKKKEAVIGYCTACFAYKLSEKDFNTPPWEKLETELELLTNQVKFLTRALLTKKGIKDLKKELNIEEIMDISNPL